METRIGSLSLGKDGVVTVRTFFDAKWDMDVCMMDSFFKHYFQQLRA